MNDKLRDKMFEELQRQAYAIRDCETKESRKVFTERFMYNRCFVEDLTGTKITLRKWELVVE